MRQTEVVLALIFDDASADAALHAAQIVQFLLGVLLESLLDLIDELRQLEASKLRQARVDGAEASSARFSSSPRMSLNSFRLSYS